jgi:hypothetical protein
MTSLLALIELEVERDRARGRPRRPADRALKFWFDVTPAVTPRPIWRKIALEDNAPSHWKYVATPVGFEPTTPSLEGWCSPRTIRVHCYRNCYRTGRYGQWLKRTANAAIDEIAWSSKTLSDSTVCPRKRTLVPKLVKPEQQQRPLAQTFEIARQTFSDFAGE